MRPFAMYQTNSKSAVPFSIDKSDFLRIRKLDHREITSLLGAVASSVQRAGEDIPQHSSNRAARMAAARLRTLFAHHGLQFSATFFATADGDEKASAAVTAMLKAANMAGESMTKEAARKWIEFAIHEAEQKSTETIDEKLADGFRIP